MQLVVVDTNVLIAGVLTSNVKSPTARVVEGILNGNILFLLSPALLAEYRAVLLRMKLIALHGLTVDEAELLLTELVANALWCESQVQGESLDSKDNHLWALLDEEPNVILVTGDQLLLQEPHAVGRVIPPSDYVAGDFSS
ncbi:MAG: putative toxin-antitoxin system toxin component, PIN family [Deltaproteobacteria bacterium]|nr:putative toxin-antitoxin system toxin component, PIN family [Deltaproteobacteria bacterium]MBT7204402.1 putative toxin-antitoxin system toxin component, PIN family [Deltaproteobacteria bacterium]